MTVNHMNMIRQLIKLHIAHNEENFSLNDILKNFTFPSNIPSLSKAPNSLKLSIIKEAVDEIPSITYGMGKMSCPTYHVPFTKYEEIILTTISKYTSTNRRSISINEISKLTGMDIVSVSYFCQMLFIRKLLVKNEQANYFYFLLTEEFNSDSIPLSDRNVSGWLMYPNKLYIIPKKSNGKITTPMWKTIPSTSLLTQHHYSIISYIQLR